MTQATIAQSRASNAEQIARYTTGEIQLPDAVVDHGRKCLADWVAVVIGAHDQRAGLAAREVAASWETRGRAAMLFSGRHAAAPAALVNGTFAHCLDFDDTHFGSLAHLCGPTWAAALALGMQRDAAPGNVLVAFVAGYEVAARLGQGELGQTVTKRGVHATAIFGRIAATIAAARLLGLSPDSVVNALGAAATQCMGLVASFGTMSKPLHAGKAAFDGVLSAQLAGGGFVARPDLLEPHGETLAKVLVQDGEVGFPQVEFDGRWEVLQNTFKPYAACNLTHATIEAAQKLAQAVESRQIARVVAKVHPTVLSLADKKNPRTPLEGKFSNTYCAALGLLGFSASKEDFSAERLADARIQDLARRVRSEADASQTQTSASLIVTLADGGTVSAETLLASGNPGNPLSWEQMEQKFASLVEPVLGREGCEIFENIRNFGELGSLQRIGDLMSKRRSAP